MKTDEEWMIEYQNGNEEAFNVLYEKYAQKVYGFIKKKLRPHEVEDIYQKVWFKLHEKRSLYRDQPFAPWFFVMIKHTIIDEYRSAGRRSTSEFKEELLSFLVSKEMEESTHDVEEILGSLNPETQELVRRYYIDGDSYDELALETGLSQTSLRQRLSRAIRGVRKAYEK